MALKFIKSLDIFRLYNSEMLLDFKVIFFFKKPRILVRYN
jgi:hypothetical protein